ncbi:methyltransferase RsmF C-terminal domain-like protein [Parapedobacter koreensis]|uniref:16S rRNA C967 or C1407 C5-methylase, RsmB/RsmF family n=1 Tax=Parapedobacter koreensis TaxID=332977 RepID=A0A1H7Q6T1_9SPHI|nr:RNA methyltransferase [Parapedobacter koreensis]SEL43438.1 16S rRNA C967 or C1407 C5-methylase, RsmB/RsmF family [Parapedobacter koreensis]
MSNIIPPALVRRLGNLAGFDTVAFEAIHEQEGGITSIRINPAKANNVDTASLERVPWCDKGFYLAQRPVFTLDPLFHAGCYYVQEASSMFIAHAISKLALDERPLVALDLCAAPGGKSTLLNTYLHPDSLLIANELIKTRVTTLADNLVRWGHTNTVVTNNDPSAFRHLPGYVDMLLVDAPCSGSGMFRKDHAAIAEWSEGAVMLCSERQRRILADSLPTLKEEGILLYSTCSYSVEENEEIADWLCDTQGMEPIGIPIDEGWGIEQTLSEKHACPGYRFYPHKLRGEGFYLAAFRKVAPQSSFDQRKVKTEKALAPMVLTNWLAESDAFFSFTVGDDLHILPKGREADLRILRDMLYLRNAGTRVGRPAKGELIPAHDLALSNAQHPDLPQLALDKEYALEYLRKGNLPAMHDPNGPKGWALASYKGTPLGWVKVLPARINNYYPKEWRIATL